MRIKYALVALAGLFLGSVAGGVHAIDTGCVWGGPLTAIELVPPGEPPHIVQVPGREKGKTEKRIE